MKRYVLTLALALGASGVWAQDNPSPVSLDSGVNLTLDQAVSEAEQKSPVYQQAQAQENETSWEQFQAFSEGFLPKLSISGRHMFDVNYATTRIEFPGTNELLVFPGIYPETSLTVDASMDIFDGFKNIHQLDSANNRHEAASILSSYALFQLQQQVRLKFYEALAAQKLSDMADQNVTTLQDHLRIVNDQLQNGQATKYDLLRVSVQLDEAKSDQIAAHDNVALARESLTQAMGLGQDDRSLTGDLPVPDLDPILQQVANTDLSQRPDLKAQALQAQAALDDSAASGASLWIPQVSLIGEYQEYNSPDYFGTITGSSQYRNDYYVGAAASWNILDGGDSLAKANAADAKADAAGAGYRAALLEAPYDFDYWKRKMVSSAALYKAKQADVAEGEESVRLAKVGFEAGTRTTTDVLDAELEEYQAAAGLVQAQVDTLEALINLELSIGKRIEND